MKEIYKWCWLSAPTYVLRTYHSEFLLNMLHKTVQHNNTKLLKPTLAVKSIGFCIIVISVWVRCKAVLWYLIWIICTHWFLLWLRNILTEHLEKPNTILQIKFNTSRVKIWTFSLCENKTNLENYTTIMILISYIMHIISQLWSSFPFLMPIFFFLHAFLSLFKC